jgi:hypothetical protein
MSGLFCFCWLLVIASGDPNRACLNGYPSVPREFRESTFVFIGTVIAERRKAAEEDQRGFLDGVTYTVRLDERFKGPSRNRALLFSENSTARYPMKVGQRYLVFAYLESGRRYAVNNCGNTEPFDRKSRTLSAVRKLDSTITKN